MASSLRISVGQYSDKGRKDTNQDFHGLMIPEEPRLSSKGIAVALADGISSSDVSQEASQSAVVGFLDDYYCTSETWSVKTSAQRVLFAINSWLHAQTRRSQHRYDMDKGYVCTFSAMVIKSTTAHIFHVGDARIYRLVDGELEQLTDDHRLWVSGEKSYIGRALGVSYQVEIDYQALAVEIGDIFVLATDGVYEHVNPRFIADSVLAHAHHPAEGLDAAAKLIVEEAYRRGSPDNLTIQIVRIDDQPSGGADELHRQLSELPFPPDLDAKMDFDGYRIIRRLHAGSRSHAWLAVDTRSGQRVAIKTPSTDLRADPPGLERFFTEEWIARRINNAHVLKSHPQASKRSYVYVVSEFIDGRTLAQWMSDHPKPDLPTIRSIVEQIANGLQAFHRLEMVHQDIRPANIMIDGNGTVTIIDFGSTRVAGLVESVAADIEDPILGTEQYAAPEYFLGDPGTPRSDMFSLGVIAYQLLTGRLPYGAEVAKSRTRAAQRRLVYHHARDDDRDIPAWVDDAIRKAVHPNPDKRYAELSEFVFDLHHPSPEFLGANRQALLERNPVAFWKGLSLLLLIVIIALVASHALKG